MSALRRAAIAGIGETEYAKRGRIKDRSELALATEAVNAAALDMGIDTAEIDGLVSFANEASEPALMQATLRMKNLRLAATPWTGGGGGSCGAVALAAAAVEAGYANTVAVYRSLRQSEGKRFGEFQRWSPHAHFGAPFGLLSPVQGVAMMAQRYRHRFGLDAETLAGVCITFREHAGRNPRAIMREPVTLDDYLASRPIADPLRLLDCCLESDGACAVIVTTAERARNARQPGVRILAASQGGEPEWGTGFLGAHAMADAIYDSANARTLAGDLFGRAGISPSEIDVAQIYDAFSVFILFVLEDYGFCARGAAASFLKDVSLRWDGRGLPANTAGGNLSEAYLHGLSLVVEGVRQMRGTSTSQVDDAQTCFVCGGPSVTPTSALVLAR